MSAAAQPCMCGDTECPSCGAAQGTLAKQRPKPHPHLMTDSAAVLAFVLAGSSRFTLVSKETGKRLTFWVRKPSRFTEQQPYFVKIMYGPDNEKSYAFLGLIFNRATYRLGRKSAFAWESPAQKAFAWFWVQLKLGRLSDKMEFWHEGRCGRCGRTLTVPSSVEAGIGPECAGAMGQRSLFQENNNG